MTEYRTTRDVNPTGVQGLKILDKHSRS